MTPTLASSRISRRPIPSASTTAATAPLLRETRWTIPGASDAVVSYDQDDAFRLWKLGVQGTAPIEHGYDANDALTQAGPLTILRDPQTSLPDITRAGAVETNLDVSQFGEPERFAATFRGTAPV